MAGPHAALETAGGVSSTVRVGPTHAPEERTAERVADLLTVAAPAPRAQCGACADADAPCPACSASTRNLGRMPSAAGAAASRSGIERLLPHTGSPLPEPARTRFEQRLGMDLSHLRLHTGAEAADASRRVHARAFSTGRHIAWGETAPDPSSAGGEHLLAHEVAHTLQSGAGSWLRRDTRGLPPAPERTPAQGLELLLDGIENQALAALQGALDRLDETGVREAGRRLLLRWHLAEGQRGELLHGAAMAPASTGTHAASPRSPGSPASPLPPPLAAHHQRVSALIVEALWPRSFAGQRVGDGIVSPPMPPDLGLHIWEQIEELTWLVRDCAALVALLRRAPLPENEQWRAVGLLREHQQPRRFAFMSTVLRVNALATRPDRFDTTPRAAWSMMLDLQPRLRREHAADVLGEPGTYALLPAEGRVRLVLPATPAEIATEFYGEADRWRDVLQPYNRSLLANADGGSWLAAGSELVLDPQAMNARWRDIFAAALQMRRRAERSGSEPYLWLRPEEPIVVGNTQTIGVSWPNSLFAPVRLAWWAENDPVAVRTNGIPARVDMGSGRLAMGSSERAQIEPTALAPGNHVIKCSLTEENGTRRELSRTITVLTLAGRTEVASRYALPPLHRPAEIIAGLRAQRDALPASARSERAALEQRIAALQETIGEADREARRYRGPGARAHFTPIRALYVSAEDAPMTVPLQIFVDRDPGYFDALDTHLKLWDFTLDGSIRNYPAAGRNYADALRALLRTFADDAPYPTGNIRFIDVDFTPIGPYHRPPETLTLATDGGTELAGALRSLSMGALAVGVVAAAALQPEIALPAFVLSGLLAGAAGTASIHDRLSHGDFEWDIQAGLDILDIGAALLTAGIASGLTTTVRGAGRMTISGTLQLRIGQAQLGIMTGIHLTQISAAVNSGDRNRITQALLHAVADGALVLIVHRAGRRLVGAERRSMASAGGPERPLPPPTEPVRATAATAHERAVADTLRSGMGVRPPPLPARADSAALPPGTVVSRNIGSLAEARRVYDEASARAPDREVAIWYNRRSGVYAVTVGTEGGVSSPLGSFGEWAGVQHSHPNRGNVLTYRNPAPQDVNNALVTAALDGRAHTEFIEHRLPGGGRSFTAYTAHPDGRVVIEFERPDGSRSTRSFASLADYQADWSSRSRALDPDPASPDYRDLMRDLDDFYAGRRREGATMAGTSGDRPASGRAAERAARAESLAWWRRPGVTTETRFARHEQSFRSIAATLRNLIGRPGARIVAVNEAVLDMPVDQFIRSRPPLAAEMRAIERDAVGHPELRRALSEFLEGRLEAGAREVGARRPDLVEFFLDRGDVVVTDFTLDTSRVHRLKTAFYREVMAALLGRRGPRVSSLDINLATGEADVRP